MVDLCAERSYISEVLVQTLGLKKRKTDVNILGINGISSKSSSSVQLKLKLSVSEEIALEALVVPNIIGSSSISLCNSGEGMQDLKLADPHPHKKCIIGALIGSDVAPKLFLPNTPNKITSEGLLLQPTKLVWLISGTTKTT
ncbi:hypothetical protein ACFFRR_005820 [Megaselia abdita]